MKRKQIIVFVVWAVSMATSCAPTGPGTLRSGATFADGTITRDRWGVPYIEAADDGQAAYAVAWAMAEDGLRAMEDAYAQALDTAGTAAARYAFANASPEVVRMSSAFAAGLNDYRRQHPTSPPRRVAQFEAWMVYSFAHGVALQRPVQDARGHSAVDDAFVAAGVSASGDALFAASGASALPYEVDIRIAGGHRIHGFAELGMPFIREGYTRHVAFAASPQTADSVWAHNAVDQWVAMAHAETAAQTAAAAAGGADRVRLAYIHVSGVSNTTVEASPASRAAFAAQAVVAAAPLSVAKLTAIAFDSRMNVVDTAIAGLVDEWEQVGARNSERAATLDSAIQALRGWDGRVTATSMEATLMAAYVDQLATMQGDGAYTRFRALETVVQGRTQHQVPWSRSHPLVRPLPSMPPAGRAVTPPMPVAAASGRYGTMFAYESAEPLQRRVWSVNITAGVGGAVLSYGQSWDPASVHWFDQAALFASATLKTVAADGAAAGGRTYRPAVAAETR